MSQSEQHKAFSSLLAQHQDKLYGYIHALLRNFADSEDVYQQTTLVLWKKFDEYQPNTSFFSWACRVAQFEVRNFIRRSARDHLYLSEPVWLVLAAAQEARLDSDRDEQLEALEGCVETLPEADRHLLDDCYGTSKSFVEVARQLDRSPQSIYDALSRIRHTLAVCIKRVLARKDC